MAPQLGQEAILNGKPVRWSGDDYGWQSTGSYDKLDKKGEFKLGSSLARRAAQAFEQAEDFRHSVFGTPSPDSVSGRIISKLDSLVEAFPLTQGEDIAMGHAGDLAGKLGISPALGALALGTVLPGPGEGKAVSRVGNYTSPAQRAAIKARARRTPTSRVGPNSQWDNPLTPEQKQLAQADAVRNSQRAVSRNNDAIADVINPDSPAARIRAHIGDRPNRRVPKDDRGGPAWISNKDGTYTNQSGVDIAEQSSIKNPKDRQWPNEERKPFVETAPDNREPSIMPPGPGKRPASQSQFDAPYDSQSSRGNGPEPTRVFKPDDLPRKELDIPDVKPSDLAKPRGDGNQYGNFEQVAGLREGWSRSGGQFITDNQQARRQGRDKTRQIAVDKQTPNFDEVRSQVDWADGDPDKLDAIARRLGVEPNKYASKTKTAILKRLNKLENDPKARKALEADWDWENLRGEDLTEARRLSELATERKGELVRPQVGEYFQGADVPRNIQDRLDNLANDGQRPSQARSQKRNRSKERGLDDGKVKPSRSTERAEELTTKSDKEILENIEKYLDVPESARDHRRRVRSQRPLRDRSLRTKQVTYL